MELGVEGLRVVLQQAAEWKGPNCFSLVSEDLWEEGLWGSEVQLALVAAQRYVYQKQEISPRH